jgi:hypothetical protein
VRSRTLSCSRRQALLWVLPLLLFIKKWNVGCRIIVSFVTFERLSIYLVHRTILALVRLLPDSCCLLDYQPLIVFAFRENTTIKRIQFVIMSTSYKRQSTLVMKRTRQRARRPELKTTTTALVRTMIWPRNRSKLD